MPSGLKGKKVLVTGASGGIGRSMAMIFGAQGCEVGLHYRGNKASVSDSIQTLRSKGVKAEAFQGDLLDARFRSALIDSFAEEFGGMDVLINNAGAVIGNRDFRELSESDWQATLDLNLWAPFALARSAWGYMERCGSGRIINISSIGVKFGGSSRTLHYAAAKSALETITLGLAKRGAPFNILVNAIRAGVIDTPLHKDQPEKDMRARVELIPLKRIGQPEDVASLAAYLASDDARFITGQIFAVSGGE